ncbi:MAG: 16S rRNA processing protein RimM [Prevotella sp.]|nr:16S rRNA processing protein RimM [Prevotella sp.]
MIKQENVFQIGRIGKSHGIHGEVTMHITDDVFDRVESDFVVLEVDGILVPFFMEEYRFRSDETVLVKFSGIDSQEQVRQLTHCGVFFPRDKAVDGSNEVSWAQLSGLSVIDQTTGKPVGEIKDIDYSTINMLFEIATPDGRKVLVPASEELIEDIDLQARIVRMRLPEGLLDL